jgi:hypothetical protein
MRLRRLLASIQKLDANLAENNRDIKAMLSVLGM